MHCVSENWVCRKTTHLRSCTTTVQYFAYSYRVWITLIKLLSAPLWYLKSKPDIHQPEYICGRLLPLVLRVSEKNPTKKPADQARSRTPRNRIPIRKYGY